MKDKLNVIALAALLHDIGKVGQRAYSGDKGLSKSTLGLAEYLCPSGKDGRLTHKHVLYTNEYIEATKDHFPDKLNISEIANLASYHHNPSDDYQKIITQADHLSSAMERETLDYSTTRTDFRNTLLSPVTNYISAQPDCRISEDYKYDLSPYSIKLIFPSLIEAPESQIEKYKAIWDNLIETIKKINMADEIKFINTFLSILEKYLWAVPSATNVEVPDISLFDHLKTTSAIAGCIYLSDDMNNPFILAAGDFGGIQKYIFNLKPGSGGIAKALRGRSFEVGSFSDSTAVSILNDLGLSMAHLIMNSGGKFFLLLPNTEKTSAVLTDNQKRLHDWILEERNGELRFNMSWMEVSKDDIKDFPSTLDKINEKLNAASFRGLKSFQQNNKWMEDKWTRPGYSDKYEGLCKSCHSNKIAKNIIPGETEDLCENCSKDREIGKQLVKSKFQVFDTKQSLKFKLPFLSYNLLKEMTEPDNKSDLVIEFRGELQSKYDTPYFTILKNNWVPRDEDNNVREFDWIAEKSKGRELLGYLKADVDNLGFIFSRGLVSEGKEQKDRTSISRQATLSRSLEYFFAGFIYHFLEEKYPTIYTVFSGGDDLFLIGPWDKIFDMAQELRSEFARYTCNNKSWSLSAGIAVVKHKTPVLHGQQLASINLDLSKKKTGKDSITAFSTTMSWEEYSKALKQGNQLVEWIEDGTLNSSKVYRFMTYAQELKKFDLTRNTSLLQVIPQMIYDLTRNWDNKTGSQKDAKKWAHAYTNPENKNLKILPFICEYALTKTK